MYIDTTPMRNRGVILPIALILMAFATTMIIAAGISIQRSSRQLNSYALLSDLRVGSNNLVEIATVFLSENYSDMPEPLEAQWEGFSEFVAFISSRGGYEGVLWQSVMSDVGAGTWWLLSDENLSEAADLNPLAEFDNRGVAVSRSGDKYSVISWVEKGAVKRYSYGLAMVDSLAQVPALILGDIDREFDRVTTTKQKGYDDYISSGGDWINGHAILLGDAIINSPNSDLPYIFSNGLTAHHVSFSPEKEDDQASYNATDTDSASYFVSLLEDKENQLNNLSKQIVFTDDNKNLFSDSTSTFSPDSLISFNLSSTDSYTITFPKDPTTESNDYDFIEVSCEAGDSGTTKYTIIIEAADHTVSLSFNKSVNIVNKNGNPHMIGYINGRYSISVFGDINIDTNLIYGDSAKDFVIATRKSDNPNTGPDDLTTLTRPIMSLKKVEELFRQFELDRDYLSLSALGGNVINTFGVGTQNEGNATHGVRAICGDVTALARCDESNENCVGGSFLFPDLETVISGNKTYTTKLSQLFVLGSVVGNSFGTDGSSDYIENFFVTVPSSGDSGGTSKKVFSLVGLRAW